MAFKTRNNCKIEERIEGREALTETETERIENFSVFRVGATSPHVAGHFRGGCIRRR